jgi:magnesium chelatase family protein
MNPCPCGYLGDRDARCRCGEMQIQHYRARISGPLLDRIDLHIEMPRPEASHFRVAVGDENAVVAGRVAQARALQGMRGEGINARLQTRDLQRHCVLKRPAERLLEHAMRRLSLSARAHDRILKVARTIADLEAAETILEHHLAEAIQLRRAERAPARS